MTKFFYYISGSIQWVCHAFWWGSLQENPLMVTCHAEGMFVKTAWMLSVADINLNLNGDLELLIKASPRCSCTSQQGGHLCRLCTQTFLNSWIFFNKYYHQELWRESYSLDSFFLAMLQHVIVTLDWGCLSHSPQSWLPHVLLFVLASYKDEKCTFGNDFSYLCSLCAWAWLACCISLKKNTNEIWL